MENARAFDDIALFGDLGFATNARGVDEEEVALAGALDQLGGVDGIARRPRAIVDEHALFAGERGLSDDWPALGLPMKAMRSGDRSALLRHFRR